MSKTAFIKVAFFDLGNTLIGSNRDWIPGARETLANLHQKQVRLGLISNTGNLSRPEIINLLPQDFDLSLFEKNLLIFSSEVHVEKPDRDIFRLAIQRSGVTANNGLFCTEELSHISAAKQENMQTFLVRKPPDSDIGELIEKLTALGLLPV
jgi:putative hydrolase of the HAD superfamily